MKRFLNNILACAIAVALSQPGFAASLADAAQRGAAQEALALVQQGADVNQSLSDGSTALLWAVHHNNVELVKALLAKGADAAHANSYGITPLAQAIESGNLQILELLLASGLDVNQPLREGETALMVAAAAGSVEAVQLLLKHGADANKAESWKGQTALMWAAAQNHAGVVKLLLAAGASPDLVSRIVDYRDQPSRQGSVKMTFPRGGFTALLFAARNGSLESASLLLQQGANINLADPDHISALTMALINYHFDVAALLLDQRIDVNAADDRNRTPLWAAVDMHTVDYSNRPTTHTEDRHSCLDLIKQLLATPGIDVNHAISKPVEARAVLDTADTALGNGTTALMRAARGGDTEVMELLLNAGADPARTNARGATAMMLAAGLDWRDGKTRGTEMQVLSAVALLIAKGQNVNAVDAKGNTALHGAAFRGVDSVIEELVQHGADLTLRNAEGKTPLDVASSIGGIREPLVSTVALLEKLATGKPSTR